MKKKIMSKTICFTILLSLWMLTVVQLPVYAQQRQLTQPLLEANPQATVLLGSEDLTFSVGEAGALDIDRSDEACYAKDALGALTQLVFSSDDESVLAVDGASGAYKAVSPGKAAVTVKGYTDYQLVMDGSSVASNANGNAADANGIASNANGGAADANGLTAAANAGDAVFGVNGAEAGAGTYEAVQDAQPVHEELFSHTVEVQVQPDVSGLTLGAKKAQILLCPYPYSIAAYSKDTASCARIRVKGIRFDLADYLYTENVQITSDNKSMHLRYRMDEGNVLVFEVEKPGTAHVDLTIFGKEFQVELTACKFKPGTGTSVLLTPGGTKDLSVAYSSTTGSKNYVSIKRRNIVWKTSNKRVATVDAQGRIHAKKAGAAYVTGRYKQLTFYWAVNVTTPKKRNAILRAKHLCKGTYSQPKRMSHGFYDCSSLVWRAYAPEGIYIGGATGYAPTAASEAQYYHQRGNMIRGSLAGNLQNLKLRAGDLYFEGGADNGRFAGIYHVEMFTGYDIAGIGEDKKPVFTSTWANRTNGYYAGYDHDFIARP